MRFTHDCSQSSRLVKARCRRFMNSVMTNDNHIAHALAAAVTAGPITEHAVVARIAQALGKRWRWLRPLARRIEANFAGHTRPRRGVVQQWVMADEGFCRACERHEIEVVNEAAVQSEMCAAAGASTNGALPSITTVHQLADWVDLPFEELDWLADRRGREASTEATYRRYRYRAHLAGRVAFVGAVNPHQGQRLQTLLTQIEY